MFSKSFCVFLALCGYVNSSVYTRDTFIKNSSSDIQKSLQKFPKSKLIKSVTAIKNDDTRTKKIGKRGIVMVDSDFDIPSEMYENELDIGSNVFDENGGSGIDDDNNEEHNNSTEDDDIKFISELQKIANLSTVLTQSTIKVTKSTTEKMSILTSIIAEGSGDDAPYITEEYNSTKEMSTISSTTSGYEIQEKIPDVCMSSICEINDLFIFTSEERSNIPEGKNFTLTCKSNNSSLDNMLYWYKNNGSEYFLQTLGMNTQLHFNIPNTKLMHSGIYVCVKQISKKICCNRNLNLIIYEVPFYQYHLITIGLVTLAGLLLCILLSVRQSITMKKYTKEFVQKHGKFKNLL